MSGRGGQAVAIIGVILLGFAFAAGVNGIHTTNNGRPTGQPSAQARASASPSPSASASASASSSPSPVPSPSAAPSPSPTEAPSPSAAPTPAATQSSAPPPPAGGAAYPAQVKAGSSYSYSGSGSLAAFASDSAETAGSVCAGINTTSQDFARGQYAGYYFVSITFPDGVTLAAGDVRTTKEQHDFASYQKGSAAPLGSQAAEGSTPDGTHTYCLSHGSGGWTATRDGSTIACGGCPQEPAADTRGATIKFESLVSRIPGATGPVVASNFTIPGFHDISVGGNPPRQLRGTTQAF
jgi:hypothetical protein